MQVKSVNLNHWKRHQSATFDIQPLNLLTGPNGSGKTSILQALSFAVQGRTSLGGRNDDTAQLCGPNGGGVRVTLNDGSQWDRSLFRDVRKGTITQELSVSEDPGAGLKESDAFLGKKVGRFAPMFDINEVLGLAADKRRRFFMDLCSRAAGEGAVDVDEILQRTRMEAIKEELGEATVEAFVEARAGKGIREINIEQVEGFCDQLDRDLSKEFRTRLQSSLLAIRTQLGGDLTTAIQSAIDGADAGKNASRQAKDRAHAAVEQMSQEKVRLAVPAASAAQLTEERTKLLADREEITSQIARQEGKESARTALLAAISRLNKEADDKAGLLTQHQSNQPPAESAATAKMEEAAAIETAAQMPPNDGTEAEHANATLAVSAARNTEQAANEQYFQAKQEVQRLEGMLGMGLARLRKVIEEANHVLGEIDEGSGLETWRIVYQITEEICPIASINTMQDDWEEANKVLAESENKLNSAKQATGKALDAANTIGERLQFIRAERSNATIKYQSEINRATALRREAEGINAERSQHALNVKQCEERIEQIKAEKIEAERRLNDLDAEGGQINIDDLNAQATRIAEAIRQADADIASKQQYAALESELTRCAAEAEKETVAFRVWESIGKGLRTIREVLIPRIMAPLLDRVNHFLSIARPGAKAYCDLVNDRGTAIFELGWILDGMKRVSLPAMSGGETAMYCAALAYAMVVISDAPLKLLMLELGEADICTTNQILLALTAVRADVSNVIVATQDEGTLNLSVLREGEWNRIRLPLTDAAKDAA